LLQLVLAPAESVDAVTLGSSAGLAVGDMAIAIGNPHGRASTVTAGIVSAKNRSIRVKGRWAKLPHLLESDAAINAGNSGGPLLDRDGRLIGINSAGGKVYEITGFAIAVDHVRDKLQSVLLSPEKLRSPWLGLSVADRGEDVVVRFTDASGPAARAGIEADDVLRGIDGEPVRWSVGWALTLLRKDREPEVELEVERGGKRKKVTVEPLPAPAFALLRQTGLAASELSPRADADLVQRAWVALWRRVTGDPNAEPTTMAERLVRIDRVPESLASTGADVKPLDLLLGVELAEDGVATAAAGRLVRFERVADAARCFQENATYDGTKFQAWIWRAAEVRRVELTAKRLLP
jgi:hypothetical protein